MTTRWPRSDAATRPVGPRGVFWWTLVLSFVVSVCWALGNPPTAAPDEPAHAIKAAAVVRGEFLGDETDAPLGSGWVEVPALFDAIKNAPVCFAFHPEIPASCAATPTGDLAAPDRALTSAVRYSPTYYLVAGLPSLVGASTATLYAMRLAGALLCALLLALALRTVVERPRPAWLLLGTAAGITPMVSYLNGSINPQGLEISAAVLVWVALLALLQDPQPDLTARRLVRFTLGVVLLATTRSLGPLFVVTIVAVVMLVSPMRHLVALLRQRRTWVHLAVCAVAGAAAVTWVLTAGALSVDAGGVRYPYLTPRTVFQLSLRGLSGDLQNAMGVFGWGDTPLPGWAYLVVAAPIVLLVTLALAFGGVRERLALIGLGAAVVALPIVAQVGQAPYINLFWQGRYALPLIVGLPVIAGAALVFLGSELPGWFTRRLLGAALTLTAAVQVLAVVVNLQRHVNGVNGGWFRPSTGSWLPPVSPYLIVGLAAAAWTAQVVVWCRAVASAPANPPTDRTRAVPVS